MPSVRTLVLVGLAVAAWTAMGTAAPASRGGQTTADEPQYLMTAISLAEDQNLDISDERAEERFRVFHRADLPVQEEPRDDGVAVSPHDPLLPAILTVPVGFGGWIGGKLALAVLAGVLAAALVWVAVKRFAVPTRVAVITVLAFSAGAPLAMYATQVYPELPAALAVTIAIGALLGRLGRGSAWACGAAIVSLPWLSVKYAPVAVVLAALLLVALWRSNPVRAVWAAAALAVAGVVFAVAHLDWYGGLTPYASGDHFVGGELTVMGNDPDYFGRAIRIVGLMLDRDFGLAAWHPLYLLAIPAFVVLLRDRPRGWFVLTAPLAVGWLNATFVALTMHGWWWPGRQVVVVLPAIVLGVAWWAASSEAITRVIAVLGLFGASVFAWLVAQAVFGDLTLVVHFETITYPLVRAWRVMLPDYRDLGAGDWLLHGAWLVVIGALALRLVRTRFSIQRIRLQGAPTS